MEIDNHLLALVFDGQKQGPGTEGLLYEDITRNFLLQAGIRPGMKVLDVGCGTGRVSFIAAGLIGPSGEVLAFDISGEAVAKARQSARNLGLKNLSFMEGNAENPPVGGSFDAVIGRFVLMFLAEPAKALERLARLVRAGGVIAFQEQDYSGVRFSDPLPLSTQCAHWISKALRGTGADPEMGLKLYRTFLNAGLPPPSLCHEASIGAGASFAGFERTAQLIANLLPDMEALGIATRAEVEPETLVSRLKSEVVAHNSVVVMPPLIGAWVRKN